MQKMYNDTKSTAVGLLPIEAVRKLVSWRVLDPDDLERLQCWNDNISGELVASCYSYLKIEHAASQEIDKHMETHQISAANLWDLLLGGTTTLASRGKLPDKKIIFQFHQPVITAVHPKKSSASKTFI